MSWGVPYMRLGFAGHDTKSRWIAGYHFNVEKSTFPDDLLGRKRVANFSICFKNTNLKHITHRLLRDSWLDYIAKQMKHPKMFGERHLSGLGLQHVKQLMRNLLDFQMVGEEFTQDNRTLPYLWTSWFKTSVWRLWVIGGCEATLPTYHWSQLPGGARYYSSWPISTRIWGDLTRPSELPRKALICWRLGWHHHPRRSHALQRSKDLLCCWNSPVLPSTHWMALPADFCGILQTGVLVLPQTLHGRFFQHKTGSGGLCLLPPGLRILSWVSLDS